MFPNPFFAAMGGPFGPGLNNMGAMAGQGMSGQNMPGHGMPGFMGAQGAGMPGSAGPMVPMQGAHDVPGGAGSGASGPGGAGGGAGGGNRQQVDRNRVCLKFMQSGNCNYGDNCKYAHLTRAEASMAGPSQAGQQQGGDRGGRRGGRGDDDGGNRVKNAGARKTRLCEKFMTLGHCPYGDKCTFAHGHEELRSAGGHKEMQVAMPMAMDGPAPPPLPGPAPPPEPYPGTAPPASATVSRPPAASVPQAAKPPAEAPQPQQPASAKPQEVTFVDKVRALCGVLAIGNAASLAAGKPLALQTAAMSLRNGNAFRENPFADSVERYLQQQ